MKKMFLKILVILLVAIQVLWISLLLPGHRVEARTGQPPALSQQTILKLAPLDLQEMEKSFITSSDSATVQVGPISLLKVQTIPPVAGAHFKLGDISFVSGLDGIATLPVSYDGNYSLAGSIQPLLI